MHVRIQESGAGTFSTVVVVTPAMRAFGQTVARLKDRAQKELQGRNATITDGTLGDGNEFVKATIPFSSVSELTEKGSRWEFEPVEGTRRRIFRMSDRSFSAANLATFSFQADLPGRITRSNADSVEGSTARWSSQSLMAKAGSAEGIFAECEPSLFSLGPSAVITLAILAAGLLPPAIFYWRKRCSPAFAGAVQMESDEAVRPGEAFCENCGEQNRAAAKFCSKCGSNL